LAVCLACFLGHPAQGGPPEAGQHPEPRPAVRTDHHGDPLPPAAVARLGTVRLRPADGPVFVTYSPDGVVRL
jgi:hypothetical protein